MFRHSKGGKVGMRGGVRPRRIHGTPLRTRLLTRLAAALRWMGWNLVLILILAPMALGSAVFPSAAGPGLLYWMRNAPTLWRGAWRYYLCRLLHIPTMYATLEVDVVRANGRRERYGVVSTRVVTTAFVNSLAAFMVSNSNSPAPDAFDYHASGTGTTAEAVGDTALVTDSGVARVSGTPSNPSANIYRTVATMSYTSSLAITEHGVFSASSGGTLLDRSVFSAVNVVNGDSIQFTYSLTISAGG